MAQKWQRLTGQRRKAAQEFIGLLCYASSVILKFFPSTVLFCFSIVDSPVPTRPVKSEGLEVRLASHLFLPSTNGPAHSWGEEPGDSLGTGPPQHLTHFPQSVGRR